MSQSEEASADGLTDAEIAEKKDQIEKQIIYYSPIEPSDLNALPSDTDTIDLSQTRAHRIDNFSKFTNLLSLTYRANLLKTLLSENLSVECGLAKIRELDFYDNQIERIENVGQFGATLQSFDMSFNRLKVIEGLDELVNLKRLYLVHNHITKLENLDSLRQLELLELGDNQIRKIENLESLTNLTQLFLGKNKIKKLENLGHLSLLSVVSVQSNRLTCIEGLQDLRNLTELYLSDNGIEKMEGLENFGKLKVLDLSNNKIARVENIDALVSLEEFWFNNNMLCHWEDIDLLRKLPLLKCLYMEMNPIYYEHNTKPAPGSLVSDIEKINSSYRRKILFALPNLEQLDATLCTKATTSTL